MQGKRNIAFDWLGREDPEDGPLAKRFHHLIDPKGTHAILGFACDAGITRNKGRSGAGYAPEAIRKALKNLAVGETNRAIADLGDIPVVDDALEAGQTLLAITLDKELRSHKRILVLGGGHETAFGSFSGLRLHYPEKRIGIINLDAHLDLRAPGAAGASSGTPFYQMRESDPINFDYLCLGIAEESNTAALLQRARDWGVKTITDHELIANPNIADTAIQNLIGRNDIIYLTIDLDVMPHYQMPGVSAPAARGVSFSTIERLVDVCLSASAAAGKPMPVADIVELSPPFDKDGTSATTAAFLARKILLAD